MITRESHGSTKLLYGDLLAYIQREKPNSTRSFLCFDIDEAQPKMDIQDLSSSDQYGLINILKSVPTAILMKFYCTLVGETLFKGLIITQDNTLVDSRQAAGERNSCSRSRYLFQQIFPIHFQQIFHIVGRPKLRNWVFPAL